MKNIVNQDKAVNQSLNPLSVTDKNLIPSLQKQESPDKHYANVYTLNRQQGFTLIELMITLVLGLLISAAALQVYMINFKTSTLQKSSSDIQNTVIFGIQQLESQLRLANLGNPTTPINDKTLDGGIVLSGYNLGITKEETKEVGGVETTEIIDDYKDTGYLTRSDKDTISVGSNGWDGTSNISGVKSDQLTIQYTNVIHDKLFDCEGAEIEKGDKVVQRYFLRADTADSSETVLACDAGRLKIDDKTEQVSIATFSGADNRNFGQKGQVYIKGIDQFTVLLGVKLINDNVSTGSIGSVGEMLYVPSHAYMNIEEKDKNNIVLPKPAITSVKIGLVVHGSTGVLGGEQKKFDLLGRSITLDSGKSTKKLRTTYETTVLLRNAQVLNIIGSS